MRLIKEQNKTLNSIIFCYCQGNGTWLSDKVVAFIDSNPVVYEVFFIVMGLFEDRIDFLLP